MATSVLELVRRRPPGSRLVVIGDWNIDAHAGHRNAAAEPKWCLWDAAMGAAHELAAYRRTQVAGCSGAHLSMGLGGRGRSRVGDWLCAV